MLTKGEHIEYWKQAAANDWYVVETLFQNARYPYALFFAHLVLEKLLKAHYVKDNELDFPPKTHNLIRLATQTKLVFHQDELLLLDKMNDFQMEGRYPDYRFLIFKICDRPYTEDLLQKVEKIKQWLLNQLP